MAPRPLLALAALAVACGGSDGSSWGVPSEPSAPAGNPVGAAGQGGGQAAPVRPCHEVGSAIFAVTEQAVLLRYEPLGGAVIEVGPLRCPQSEAGAYSMAIDRTGDGLLLLQDGQLFRVTTADAGCHRVGYKPGQQGWRIFGMGYAASGPDGSDELFVADATRTALHLPDLDRGLGRLSQKLWLSEVGSFDQGLTGRVAELTGLGDGRLFAFFIQEPSVAELDPRTARVLSNVPLPIPVPTAWAFAHWGGSFYLFAASSQSTSRVYRYTPGAEPSTVQLADVGHLVVGAGVSTCAPTSPPVVSH